VKVDRLRPAVGKLPPLIARTVDVDEVVQQWRELHATTAPPVSGPEAPSGHTPLSGEPAKPRRWWRRILGA
jgi:hypothetical protein